MSDEALMDHFKDGSKKAFNLLYERYSQQLLRTMYHLLNQNEDLAQDLLHDVFVRLIENPEKFDSSRKFKSWIYTVVTNECKKQYRKTATLSIDDVNGQDILDNSSILRNINNVQFKKMLDVELKQLTFEHRSCFVLRYEENLSVKEISQISDCAEGTVKSRLHYTLKQLSSKLAIFNPIEIN
ncbi:MAG: RNA polymerase sigma-70 factor (ECF subfamily) [Bacteroidia bacterium]|jgi:RNA polymerase sigma-70 factor (ECF subfamily)